MKLEYESQHIRAKKDERPILNKGGRVWRAVIVLLNGEEKEAYVGKDWLYFCHQDQWYKVDTRSGIDIHTEVILQTREVPQQTLEAKRVRRQVRRRAKRAEKAALRATPDYSEELEE
jgi:hypothetical protein